MDIHFSKKDGGEYLKASGYVYASEDLVKPILANMAAYPILEH